VAGSLGGRAGPYMQGLSIVIESKGLREPLYNRIVFIYCTCEFHGVFPQYCMHIVCVCL
jgi:hypothetical protein